MSDNQQEFTDFPIEFYNEVNDDSALYDEVDNRLRWLAKGHTDITGATVNVRDANLGTESGTEVTVVIYGRPNNLASTVVAPQPIAAIKGALDGIERQVREQREKLRGY